MNFPVQAMQGRQSLTQHFDMGDVRLADGDQIHDIARQRCRSRQSRERDAVNGMQFQARRELRLDQAGVCPGIQHKIVWTTAIDTHAYNEDVAVHNAQRNAGAGARRRQTKWA